MTKKMLRLLSIFIVLALAYGLLITTRYTTQKPDYNDMVAASERTAQAFSLVKAKRLELGLEINLLDDPNATGIIGDSYSDITTTLGNLESKRSTTNPNMAALLVEMFKELKLQAGDMVAVNLSSSFPGANIALLCTLETMGLKGVIINSVGASTYGANLPEFTYLDMEHLLYTSGLITNHTTLFSMGGQRDIGAEMPEDVKKAIINRLTNHGYELLSIEDMDENINTRFDYYNSQGDIKCFVNVGGNLVSTGGETLSEAGGILTNLSVKADTNGLIQRFYNNSIPVIELLNIKGLFEANGLPVDPSPIPDVGSGSIYVQYAYHKFIGWIALLYTAWMLFKLYTDKAS